MKVLFTFYVPSGGLETLNRLRCHTLLQGGIQGHLLYTQHGAGIQNNVNNIPTLITNLDEQIQALLDEHQYTAIFVSSDYLMLRRIRTLGYRGPLIFEAQGLGMHSTAEQTMLEALPFLRDYANGVLLPATSHLIEMFEHHCPWLPRFSFPNVINASTFHYQARAPLPYPVLAWVGRLEKNKNWKHFLEIGSSLTKLIPALQLWMFADPNIYIEEERKQFEPMIDKLGLRNKLTIRNNVPHADMMTYFSMVGDSGGLLLSTSILEGFGYAVAEAMCCRCPVLSTDSDGVRAFIIHNQTGMYYRHGNIQQAVQGGMRLMTDQRLRASIRDAGVAHIRTHFSPDLYLKQFTKMLAQLPLHVEP
ncbi:glycosyltransferase [Paenibacillus sp. ACRRX]|uniref:glycosyltransferase family 4 protein n=1 Tax=unclassified Paenibacillus TaxID=185978 RepID=UPI001EF5F4F9|nr:MULTISPECIES: glycosyltransferase [unclassified Paenibacillus]MCG7410107.1 glycosyltransferase [Paenibacillus sp. ACRRX]MDK8183681.1 glycosyltransferase [Paenibacillus sp. UMB4589-SE434]